MKTFRFIIRRRKDGGFSIIEAVVSLLIVSIISLGATMANAQLINQTARNDNYITADRQTLNAIHWITADMQMAQTIQPSGPAGFPLTLQWVTWDNSSSQVVYSINNNALSRNITVDAGLPSITLIANYINPAEDLTYCVSSNGVLTLKITSSLTEGGKTINVSKVDKITSRPNL
ncbi:MAG: hypothetical protein A2Z29_09805 [Chloroflexi bacterium RBG_16_56_11]|nr:MAG: hypothetical protein A2Z29_09805 [Chloroflexi bacterium RBG_16_56_11]